jgi:hypothetical protein
VLIAVLKSRGAWSIVYRDTVLPQSNPPRLKRAPYLNGKTGPDRKAFISIIFGHKWQRQIYLSINITPFEPRVISHYRSIVGIDNYS